MKYSVLFALLLVAAINAGAQDPISIDRTMIDFGSMALLRSTGDQLRITNNTSTATAVWFEVSGFNAASFDVGPDTIFIPGGQTYYTTVSFAPTMSGPNVASIGVRTAGEYRNTIELRGIGDSTKPNIVLSQGFLQLSAAAGSAATQTIRLSNTSIDGVDVQYHGNVSLPLSVIYTDGQTFRLPGKASIDIDVTYAPTEGGTSQDSLYFDVVGEPGIFTGLYIQGYCQAEKALYWVPQDSAMDYAIIRARRVGASATHTVRLVHNGSTTETFTISANDPTFTVSPSTLTLSARSSGEVVVTYTAASTDNVLAQLDATSAGRSASMVLNGMTDQAPWFIMAPHSLVFTSATTTHTVTVTNDVDVAYTVNLTTSGDERYFTVTPAEFELGIGEAVEVTVEIHPEFLPESPSVADSMMYNLAGWIDGVRTTFVNISYDADGQDVVRVRASDLSGPAGTQVGMTITALDAIPSDAVHMEMEIEFNATVLTPGFLPIADRTDNGRRTVTVAMNIENYQHQAGSLLASLPFTVTSGNASQSEVNFPSVVWKTAEGQQMDVSTSVNGVTTTVEEDAAAARALRIAPNPASTQCSILLNGSQPAGTITVFNAQGLAVWQHSVAAGATSVDMPVAELSAGSYIVRFTGGGGTFVRQMIKH